MVTFGSKVSAWTLGYIEAAPNASRVFFRLRCTTPVLKTVMPCTIDRVGSKARQAHDVTGNEGLWEEKAMKSKLTDSMAFNWTSRLCLAQSSVITSRMSPDVLNTIIMTGDG